jgi:ribosomal protein S18 acetylase RimI-like enzyme
VRQAGPADAAYVRETLGNSWGGSLIAVHGELIDASALPALVAWLAGVRAGLLTYRVSPDGSSWEIVSLDATLPGRSAGSALIEAIRDLAQRSGARRIWLITTNENTSALRFYQRRGFDLVSLRRDAVTGARDLKPSIPLQVDGIPLRHELELELTL